MMKYILFIIFIFSFYSCKKCATCTRTWYYKSHELFPNGGIGTNYRYDGPIETFSVCGSNDIKNEEKEIKTVTVTKYTTYSVVTTGTGACKCMIE